MSELVLNDDLSNEIRHLSESPSIFSTVDSSNRKGALALAKAILSAKKLELDTPAIAVKDVVIQPVEITDPRTGEVSQNARVILITDKGEAWYSTSSGVFSSLKTLFGVLGQPTWSEPVKMFLTQEETRSGQRVNRLSLA